jgi:predicted signal transduction protein with EAL and GGDEF domain
VTSDELVRRADTAMYESKRLGLGKAVTYNEALAAA